jgi:deoxyribodipyrimidine photo-lyase
VSRHPAYALHRPGADPIVVLFTRDLRVHDHPALAEAALTGAPVVPLFVVDEGLQANGFAQLNRVGFLLESLAVLGPLDKAI